MPRNPDVDAWFAAKDHPLEDAMQAVRAIALADPRVEESIKQEWRLTVGSTPAQPTGQSTSNVRPAWAWSASM